MPARGLDGEETEGLVSGDAGIGVGDDVGGGDTPDPETAGSVGVGSGEPAGGGDEEVTGEEGAGEGLPKSVEDDGAGLGTDALPHVLLC